MALRDSDPAGSESLGLLSSVLTHAEFKSLNFGKERDVAEAIYNQRSSRDKPDSPDITKEEGDTELKERRQIIRGLLGFLLAHTLKDLSLLITLSPITLPLTDSPNSPNSPNNPEINSGIDSPDSPDNPRIGVCSDPSGRLWRCELTAIDLGPKRAQDIPKYYKLDRSIVEHFKDLHTHC